MSECKHYSVKQSSKKGGTHNGGKAAEVRQPTKR